MLTGRASSSAAGSPAQLLAVLAIALGAAAATSSCYVDTTLGACGCDFRYGICEERCGCDPDCGYDYCGCDARIGTCERGCACDPDCGPGPGPGPGPGGGYEDTACYDSTQCSRGLECLINDLKRDSWCASTCQGDLDCGDDGCCLKTDVDGAYCFPPRYCNGPIVDGGPADAGDGGEGDAGEDGGDAGGVDAADGAGADADAGPGDGGPGDGGGDAGDAPLDAPADVATADAPV